MTKHSFSNFALYFWIGDDTRSYLLALLVGVNSKKKVQLCGPLQNSTFRCPHVRPEFVPESGMSVSCAILWKIENCQGFVLQCSLVFRWSPRSFPDDPSLTNKGLSKPEDPGSDKMGQRFLIGHGGDPAPPSEKQKREKLAFLLKPGKRKM
ncbi:hypothetical protein GOODEAATRI_009434 [Goodea atripinnis]|uniref:Uncharacterized protein n=1 Tax=Goodea atripinnis TaxID=208336 RepID=A0ABV0NT37_9TELE